MEVGRVPPLTANVWRWRWRWRLEIEVMKFDEMKVSTPSNVDIKLPRLNSSYTIYFQITKFKGKNKYKRCNAPLRLFKTFK